MLTDQEINALLVFPELVLHTDGKAIDVTELLYELKLLRGLAEDLDDVLYWMMNLAHGNSRGGAEFNPPDTREHEEALECAETVHAKWETYFKER